MSLPGFLNVDCRYQPGVDVVDNIGILKRCPAGSVHEIYCCHALDHFSRWDYPRVLDRWHEILKPSGRLLISTVDFGKVVAEYMSMTSLNRLIGTLYAAQDYESNCRKMIWDEMTLSSDLITAGFLSPRRVPPEHNDCSKVVIGDSGLLSLNMEAFK